MVFLVFFFNVLIGFFCGLKSTNFCCFNGLFYICLHSLSTLMKYLLNSGDLWQLLFVHRIDKWVNIIKTVLFMPVDRNSEVFHSHCDQGFIKTLGILVCFGFLLFNSVYVLLWLNHRNVVLSYWGMPIIKFWGIFCLQILDCCCLLL